VLTSAFITQSLNPLAASDSKYFHLKMPMPAPAQDSIFPFLHEQTDLMGHWHAIWLIKVKQGQYTTKQSL